MTKIIAKVQKNIITKQTASTDEKTMTDKQIELNINKCQNYLNIANLCKINNPQTNRPSLKSTNLRRTYNNVIENKLPMIGVKKGWVTTDGGMITKPTKKYEQKQKIKILSKTNKNSKQKQKPSQYKNKQKTINPPQQKTQQNQKHSQTVKKSQKQIEKPLTPPPILKRSRCGYKYIDKSQLIFQKGQVDVVEKCQQFGAFWVKKFCRVRVVRINCLENYDQLMEQREGFVRVFGKLKIKFLFYYVTEDLNDFSLYNTLSQFGSYTEQLIKKYTKKLIKTLSKLDSNDQYLNFLSPHHLYLNRQGQILIDAIRIKIKQKTMITKQEKRNYFYYMSPQLLINSETGDKNCVWSLGAVILSMIFGVDFNKNIIHPYNSLEFNTKQLEYLQKIQLASPTRPRRQLKYDNYLKNSKILPQREMKRNKQFLIMNLAKLKKQLFVSNSQIIQNSYNNAESLQFSQSVQTPLLKIIKQNGFSLHGKSKNQYNYINSICHSKINSNNKNKDNIFSMQNNKIIKNKVHSQKLSIIDKLLKLHISQDLVDFLEKCLRIQVQKRCSLKDLEFHPFLKQ